jgi:hypothetical protein
MSIYCPWPDKAIGFSHEGTREEREGKTAAKDKIALFDCFFLPLVIWLWITSSYTKGGSI